MSKFAVDIEPVVPKDFPGEEVDIYDFAEYVTDCEVLYHQDYEELDGIYRVLRVSGTKLVDGRMLVRAVLYRSHQLLEVEQLVAQWPNDLDVYSIVRIETHYHYNKLNGKRRGVYALQVLTDPQADVDLFELAPPFWYTNSECVFEKAATAYSSLSDEARLMFNAVFWNGFDFEAFCRTKFLQFEHRNGVLRSVVNKIERVLEESLNFPQVDCDRLVLSTFLSGLLTCFPDSRQKLGVAGRPLAAKARAPLDAIDTAYTGLGGRYPNASYLRLRAVVAASTLKRIPPIFDEPAIHAEEVISSYTALRTTLLLVP